jgi:outer membrane protein TolC
MRFVALFIFLQASLGHAQTPGAPLSFLQAIDLAVEKSPGFDSARKNQIIQNLTLKSAYAKLLPSIDFSTTDGLQNNVPIASTTSTSAVLSPNPTAPWYSAINLGATESLYDNGLSFIGISVGKLNQEIADESFYRSRDQLVLNVASEFYRFSLAVNLLEVKKRQEDLLNRQFKVLQSQYQQGFKMQIDYLRFKAQVSRAEIDRINAENSVTASTAQLQNLVGGTSATFTPLQVDVQRKLDTDLPTSAPDLDHFYDFKITALQEKVNEKNVEIVERNYWPQLYLTSGIEYTNENYLNSPNSFSAGHQLSWNALITLKYNLWDWGTRNRDIDVAEANRLIQDNSLKQNLLDVNTKVESLMANVNRVRHQYHLAKELLSLEDEANRQVEEKYREGKATYLDLITELNSLLDARVQMATVYFDALTAFAQHDYYGGRIYDSIRSR